MTKPTETLVEFPRQSARDVLSKKYKYGLLDLAPSRGGTR